MPWEKSFDEDAVVEKAMTVFWQKGFEPASMADLISGMGITRGSLYNAFGGKEQLFVKALLIYDKNYSRALLAKVDAVADPKKAIAVLFDTIVTEATTDIGKKGCLLVNTASELTSRSEEINAIVRTGLRNFEVFFLRRIKTGKTNKQIPSTVNAEATAKGLMAMLVSIRVLSRGLFDESSLKTIADQAQRLLR